jgi:hypothetical protein
MVGTLSQRMNAFINQAAEQTPSPDVFVTLVWPVRTFGLEILDDRSPLISLMHGFLCISHWNLTYYWQNFF